MISEVDLLPRCREPKANLLGRSEPRILDPDIPHFVDHQGVGHLRRAWGQTAHMLNVGDRRSGSGFQDNVDAKSSACGRNLPQERKFIAECLFPLHGRLTAIKPVHGRIVGVASKKGLDIMLVVRVDLRLDHRGRFG